MTQVKTNELLTPVAAYLRMSSDDQRDSIDRQKREVETYATARGYRIVVWFIDEGRSASSTVDLDKRRDFLRLLADAGKGEWRVVVCYDMSRFGRLDSIDGAFAKQTLRANGCVLDTVKEGRFDWSDPADRWKDMAMSEAAHQYARNLSRDSMSGRMRLIEAKQWPNGVVPYGYDRLYTDGSTNQLIRRQQAFRKPRGWRRHLVVNEQEAEVVRWLYAEYTSKDTGLRQLARTLNERKTPTPDGRRNRNATWCKQTVRKLLSCEAYIGIGYIGVMAPARKVKFCRTVPTRVEGCCPAIITDRGIWDATQAKLKSNSEERRRHQPDRCGILSGFVFCGHCGQKLRKANAVGSRRGWDDYVCAAARLDPSASCRQWRAWEEEVYPAVARWLVERIDWEVLRRMQARPEERKIDEEAVLAGLIESLRAKLERGTGNLLLADPSLVPQLSIQLAAWRREMGEAETRLDMVRATRQGGELAAFGDWWAKIRDTLMPLAGNAAVSFPGDPRAVVEPSLETDRRAQEISEQTLADMARRGELKAAEQKGDTKQYHGLVLVEPAVFREFWRRIRLRIHVRWAKANSPGRHRRWVPERIDVEADLNWPDVDPVATDSRSSYRSVRGTRRSGTRVPTA